MKAFFVGCILVIGRITGFSGIGYFTLFLVAIFILLLLCKIKRSHIFFFIVGVMWGASVLLISGISRGDHPHNLPALIEITITGYRKPMTYEASWSGKNLVVSLPESMNIGDRILVETKNTIYSESIDFSTWSLRRPQYFGGAFSYPSRMYMKGFIAHVRTYSVVELEAMPLEGIAQVKGYVVNHVSSLSLPEHIKGLVEGMIIGGRRLLSDDEYEGFLQSGLVHIIAVSGSNIMMLYSFVLLVFFFLPFYGRVVVGMIAILFYAMLCGLDSSVIRATIMGGISIGLLIFGRIGSLMRLIQITGIGMLSINPFLLWYDLGFVLSFMAVLGIYYFHNFCQPMLLGGYDMVYKTFLTRLFREYCIPIFGATLGVLPVLVLLENDINVFSLLANILITPFLPLFLFLSLGAIVGQETFLIHPVLIGLKRVGSVIFLISDTVNSYGWFLHISSFSSKVLVSSGIICIYVFVYRQTKGCGVNGSTSVSEAESLGSNPCVLDEITEDLL